jgi:probable F420-dependent oxidoreductase
MRISVQTFFTGAEREPTATFVAGIAKALEERDIAGVWVGEHVVTFDRYDPSYKYPYADDGAAPEIMSQVGMVEPLTALAAMAMCSSRLRLGTGIVILPQRNPLYFAKQGALVDRLSNGRFLAGVGVGWSAQEFAATGTPFEHRGARMRDYLQVVRTLWADEWSSYEGRYYTLPRCRHEPKPLQRPHPPFYFGGESEAALRRVAEFGQGWFSMRLTPKQISERLGVLKDMLAERGRTLAEIDLVTGPADLPINADTLAAYAELGVHEVSGICYGNSLDDYLRAADGVLTHLVEPARRL